MIPMSNAPSLAELARRARAHERITLTDAGADSVLIVSADDQQAILDWEQAFITETVTGGASGGPYLPNDLLATVDAASPETAEAFLSTLAARSGEAFPAEQLWAMWERMTSR